MKQKNSTPPVFVKTIILLIFAFFLLWIYESFGYWIGYFHYNDTGGEGLGLGILWLLVLFVVFVVSLILHGKFREGEKAKKVFFIEIIVMVSITLLGILFMANHYWQGRARVDEMKKNATKVVEICDPISWNFRWPCEKILEKDFSGRKECTIDLGSQPKAFSQNCRECIITCK